MKAARIRLTQTCAKLGTLDLGINVHVLKLRVKLSTRRSAG